MASEWVPPYLQPPKPKTFYDLLDICVMSVVTHDTPRKVVARVFAENKRAEEYHG